jgi:hypothetical protein
MLSFVILDGLRVFQCPGCMVVVCVATWSCFGSAVRRSGFRVSAQRADAEEAESIRLFKEAHA